jgi:glycosyltransferase involved in cell wall biosynthesis
MTTVLHVLEAVRGGTSRHVVDVVRHTHGVRHEIVVPPDRRSAGKSGARQDRAAVDACSEAGATVHIVDMHRTPVHPANALAAARIAALIRKRAPDIVHGHSSVGGALARVAAWRTSSARLYTPNALSLSRASLAIERLLGRSTDRLIAASVSEADQVASLGLVPRQRIAVIPNGIDLTPPAPATTDLRAELALEPSAPLVGCVARLVAQKAPEQYVRACAAVARRRPDVHFLLIGMGPLQTSVDEEVKAGGLAGRFHQIPWLANAGAALGQLDAFVLPSRFEGGPYTPLEAMRAGVPVVVSDVVGNRDAVEDQVSGFVVEFGDSQRTASAILRLLDEPELAASMVAAAHERLRLSFDVAIMGAHLARVYEEVLAGRLAAVG